MKRPRGLSTDHWRRLFRGGPRKAAPARGPGPHVVATAATDRPAHHDREEPRDKLRATLERWARLNAPLPEQLIRRGLVAIHATRETLGEAVRFGEAGRRATRIHESTNFTVDVVCWRSGRLGPIHDRGDSALGLLVVEGTATEILFEEAPCGLLAPSRSHVVPRGTVSVARRGEVRAVANLQAPGVDLIGLLVASPPVRDARRRGLRDTVLAGLDEVA